jgi:hypothetical protein
MDESSVIRTLYQMIMGAALPFKASEAMEWIHCHNMALLRIQAPSGRSGHHPRQSDRWDGLALTGIAQTGKNLERHDSVGFCCFVRKTRAREPVRVGISFYMSETVHQNLQ